MYQKRFSVFALGVALLLICSVAAPGKVLFEYWMNVGGTSIDSDMRTLCSFPDAPDSSELRDNLKSKVDWADNYAERARAYLTPPADGDYTFWVSGDDNCQLWLSPTDNPADAKLVAQVAGWTPVETWDWEAAQKSAPVTLKAGRKYYIEGMHKEGGGGDSITAAWGGPTIGEGPVVIGAEFLTEFAASPAGAFCPNPANGATEWVQPLLQWKGTADAQLFNIYMGTSPTLAPTDLKGVMPAAAALFPTVPLEPGTTYYWRVDEMTTTGATVTGKVWSFTAMPAKAHSPSPVDGAQFASTSLTVAWTAGQNAISHAVFGGTDKEALAPLGQTADTSFDATGLLQPATTYFWRVDETDASGNVVAGDVWTFSTFDPAGGAMAQYWDNRFFDGDPKVVKNVAAVNFAFGGDVTPGINSPDPNIPVDNFACRWSAEVTPWVSGAYRFYDVSDDGARLFLDGKQITDGWWDRGDTEDTSSAINLVAGQTYQLVMEMYENGGGATAKMEWSGPGIPKAIIPQGALQLPTAAFKAIRPSPADGATDVASATTLSWVMGVNTAKQVLYLGTDEVLVTLGDASTSKGEVAGTSFDPGALNLGGIYFWKVDAVAADGTVTPGVVWSFSVVASKVIDNFDAYDIFTPAAPAVGPIGWWKLNGDLLDSSGNGHNGTAVGDGIGFEDDPVMGTVLSLPGGDNKYVEIGAVGISGNMLTTIACWAKADNTNIPDWTLVFGFTGTADAQGGNGSHFNIDSIGGPGGVGAHCWGWEETIFTDAEALEWRHYAMTYDGTTILYYGDGLGKDTDPGKSNVQNLAIRGDRVFIGKRVTQASSFPGNVSDARVYDYVLSPAEVMSLANYSPNLVSSAWTAEGTVTASASANGRSGRCMKLDYDNSAAPNMGSASISFATPMDMVTGGIEVVSLWVRGDPCNAPAILSLTVEDSAGGIAVVADPFATATQEGQWTKVEVPLVLLAGADLTAVTKLTLGIGDGTVGGPGTLYVDDIQISRTPVSIPVVDVTAPGDVVHGIPEAATCGGNATTDVSPCGELPANVIDDSIATKYLNFKGDFDAGETASGFTVTPAAGATIVRGMTFTSANDSPERDPVAFELYGSNAADGSWTLIAAGKIVDFTGGTAWPRQKITVTPVTFDNDVPYTNYKVLFTALRGTSTQANSMQIAEVEFLGVK